MCCVLLRVSPGISELFLQVLIYLAVPIPFRSLGSVIDSQRVQVLVKCHESWW